MADLSEIAGDVVAYVTAVIHDDTKALAVADEALHAHPRGSVHVLFAALVVTVSASDTADLAQLKDLLGVIGLGYQRHLSGA